MARLLRRVLTHPKVIPAFMRHWFCLRSFAWGAAAAMTIGILAVFWRAPEWLAVGHRARPGPAAPEPRLRSTADLAPAVAPAYTAPTATPSPPRKPAPAAASPPQSYSVAREDIGSEQRVPPPPPGEVLRAAPGRLIIPVQGVRPQDLIDTYAQARSRGRRHDAIDIPAPRGTPVLAAAPGVVLKRFHSGRGGTALYHLAPDGRTVYYYAHLDRYAEALTEGTALQQGEVLGYVGDSGNAGQGNCHLHFEITTTADPARYWGATPQNPFPLLRAGIHRP